MKRRKKREEEQWKRRRRQRWTRKTEGWRKKWKEGRKARKKMKERFILNLKNYCETAAEGNSKKKKKIQQLKYSKNQKNKWKVIIIHLLTKYSKILLQHSRLDKEIYFHLAQRESASGSHLKRETAQNCCYYITDNIEQLDRKHVGLDLKKGEKHYRNYSLNVRFVCSNKIHYIVCPLAGFVLCLQLQNVTAAR